MPFTRSENEKSRRLTDGERGKIYTEIWDYKDAALISSGGFIDTQDVLTDIGLQFGDPCAAVSGLVLLSSQVDVLGPGAARATLTFGIPSDEQGLNNNNEKWVWSFGTSTVHITNTRSDELIDRADTNPDPDGYVLHYPATADTGSAIAMDGDRIEGTDIFAPAVSLTVTKIWPSGSTVFDSDYVKTVEEMTPSLNKSKWPPARADTLNAWQTGEVLFTGAHFEKTSYGAWIGVYSFLAARNEENVEFKLADGTTETVLVRGGHDVLWNRTEHRITTDAITGDEDRKGGIESVHLARVYEYSNFSDLELRGEV